jgi:hypothetical protein
MFIKQSIFTILIAFISSSSKISASHHNPANNHFQTHSQAYQIVQLQRQVQAQPIQGLPSSSFAVSNPASVNPPTNILILIPIAQYQAQANQLQAQNTEIERLRSAERVLQLQLETSIREQQALRISRDAEYRSRENIRHQLQDLEHLLIERDRQLAETRREIRRLQIINNIQSGF